MASLARRFIEPIQDLGVLNGGLYLASAALQKLTGEWAALYAVQIVAQRVQPPARAPAPRNDGVRFELIGSNHPLIARFPRAAAISEARLAAGSECIAAWRPRASDDEFFGHLWLKHASYEDDTLPVRYEFEPATRCAWDYDVYVEPQYRLTRMLGRLWDSAFAHLAPAGIEWTFSRISLFNTASIRAHRRLGAHEIMRAYFLLLGPLRVGVLGRAPFVHVSLGDKRRLRLVLRPPDQP